MVSSNSKQTIHRDRQHTRAGRHFGGIIVRHLSDMKAMVCFRLQLGEGSCGLAEMCKDGYEKGLSNSLVRKYVKPRVKAEQFLQGTGTLWNTYPRGFSLPTVAVLFPKIDNDGRTRRVVGPGVWVTNFSLPRGFRGNKAPPGLELGYQDAGTGRNG